MRTFTIAIAMMMVLASCSLLQSNEEASSSESQPSPEAVPQQTTTSTTVPDKLPGQGNGINPLPEAPNEIVPEKGMAPSKGDVLGLPSGELFDYEPEDGYEGLLSITDNFGLEGWIDIDRMPLPREVFYQDEGAGIVASVSPLSNVVHLRFGCVVINAELIGGDATGEHFSPLSGYAAGDVLLSDVDGMDLVFLYLMTPEEESLFLQEISEVLRTNDFCVD